MYSAAVLLLVTCHIFTVSAAVDDLHMYFDDLHMYFESSCYKQIFVQGLQGLQKPYDLYITYMF